MAVGDFFKIHKRVVVVDTEYTSWEGFKEHGWSEEGKSREIIQISAVVVDLVRDDLLETFSRFVYPRKNPLLSEFTKKFTGISQEDVDHGVDFREMYVDFLAFADGHPICSYARSAGVEGDGEIFKENIELYKLDVPYDSNRFLNTENLFREAGISVDSTPGGKLHTHFELELPGRIHEATHYAQSVAVSLIALKEEFSVLNTGPRS